MCSPVRILYFFLSFTLVLLNLYYYEANYSYILCHISKRRTTSDEKTRIGLTQNARTTRDSIISPAPTRFDTVGKKRDVVAERKSDPVARLPLCTRRKPLVPGIIFVLICIIYCSLFLPKHLDVLKYTVLNILKWH